jgi:hypothetical protein
MSAFARILKFSGWTLLVMLLTSLVLAGVLVGLAQEGLVHLGHGGGGEHWRVIVDDEVLSALELSGEAGFWDGMAAVFGIAVAVFCLLVVLPLTLILGVGLPLLAVFLALGAVGVALVGAAFAISLPLLVPVLLLVWLMRRQPRRATTSASA